MNVLLYGPTKIGKTTFCSEAEDALFLATEPGLNAVTAFSMAIRTWDEMLNTCAEIARGDHGFKTIIIDTIDNAYRMCAESIRKKFTVEHESDLPYGKGYSLVNDEFHRVLTKMAFLPYGNIWTSHAREIEIETRTGKYTRIVPTLPEKARNIALGLADLVLFCDFESVTGADGHRESRRVIRTKPSLYYEAGDRTGRLPETIDLDFSKFVEAFQQQQTA